MSSSLLYGKVFAFASGPGATGSWALEVWFEVDVSFQTGMIMA